MSHRHLNTNKNKTMYNLAHKLFWFLFYEVQKYEEL